MNSDGNEKPPVDRVLEALVYAPVGLAVMAWQAVPRAVGEVVSRGCAQLTGAPDRMRQARMIGEVAVNFGGRLARREVDARLADARRRAETFAVHLPGAGPHGNGGAASTGAPTVVRRAPAPATSAPPAAAPSPSAPAPGAASPPAAAPSPPAPAPGAAPPPAAAPAPPTPATAPPKAGPARGSGAKRTRRSGSAPAKRSRDGESTAAKPTPAPATGRAAKTTGAPKAKGAAKPGAAATRRAAKRTGTTAKRRSTKGSGTPAARAVTAADLPIPSYDGLSASQVVSRLAGLGPADLDAVRRYESSGRGRKTILAAVERLQG